MATRLEDHFRHRVVRCFAQRPAEVNQMWREAARRWPGAEARVCGECRLSWAAFDDRVKRATAGLQALGVPPEDRVALLSVNGIEFVFAVQAAGALLASPGIRDQTPGLAPILNHGGASVLICDAVLRDRWPAPGETPALKLRVLDANGRSPLDVASGCELQLCFAGPVKRLRASDATVIATVQGVAVDAGMALTLAADIRSDSAQAAFDIGAVYLGITAGECGTSHHLQRLIGASRAFELM